MPGQSQGKTQKLISKSPLGPDRRESQDSSKRIKGNQTEETPKLKCPSEVKTIAVHDPNMAQDFLFGWHSVLMFF